VLIVITVMRGHTEAILEHRVPTPEIGLRGDHSGQGLAVCSCEPPGGIYCAGIHRTHRAHKTRLQHKLAYWTDNYINASVPPRHVQIVNAWGLQEQTTPDSAALHILKRLLAFYHPPHGAVHQNLKRF